LRKKSPIFRPITNNTDRGTMEHAQQIAAHESPRTATANPSSRTTWNESGGGRPGVG